MCYSHFGNGVRNGAISITQWGFINDRYKVNPVGQWGKILVMAMGIVDHLGQYTFGYGSDAILVTLMEFTHTFGPKLSFQYLMTYLNGPSEGQSVTVFPRSNVYVTSCVDYVNTSAGTWFRRRSHGPPN